MNITTKIQIMSPKRAGEILDRHYARIQKGEFTQRPISPTVIDRYAADMKMGFWRLSPQPITFDENGDLLDGQHRLEAVRKSGKEIEMTISTGWPVEDKGRDQKLIDVMDTGKPRTIGQMLHIKGMANANNYAGCARFIARVALNGNNPATSFSSVNWLLDKLDMKNHIDRILANAATSRDFKSRIVGPLAFYHTAHPVKAMSFADQLFNHTTTKGSPIHTYFRWRDNQGRIPSDTHLKGFCATIRAFHQNQEISQIRPNYEAVEWLSATNPKLREQIRAAIPRT